MTDLCSDRWNRLPLHSLTHEVRASIQPEPTVKYEVWSVPSFAERMPERLDGADIGSTKRAVLPDDVLLCKINPRINRVWQVGQRPSDEAIQIASPEWVVLRTINPELIDPAYLLHFLRSPVFRRRIENAVHGVTGSHTRARVPEIMATEVPVPHIDEQRRIVDILEDHLSRLDAANTYLDATARRLRSFDDALVLSRILPGLAPGDLGQIEHDVLPALPPDWRWRHLRDVAEVVGGVTKDGKKQADPDYVEVPYLRVANVQRSRLDLNEVSTIRVRPAQATALRLLPGDVLLNEGGDRDKLARGWVWAGEIDGCIHQNHVFRARPRVDQVRSEWIAWSANTYGARWAHRHGRQSVNLASISLKTLGSMPVPIAPLAIQDAHLAKIATLRSDSEVLAAAAGAGRQRSARLRRALLAAAFSGRLTGRSSDLDLAEELASA